MTFLIIHADSTNHFNPDKNVWYPSHSFMYNYLTVKVHYYMLINHSIYHYLSKCNLV